VTRLSASAAPELVPVYDRTAPPRIVHLGVGAFARAHLGTYADELLRAGWPATIRGVSLRSPTAEHQLGPQDGLYSLVKREPSEERPPRVLGAITSVATGSAAAVAAIADPATTLVTLTVTEKAYAPDAVPAVVAAGLARRGRTTEPPVIASLDNLADNGSVLRARVLEAAGTEHAAWIADSVRFPSSVVDRMVPATTADDLDEVERRLGIRDEAAVVAEAHCSWVIAGTDGLPPLEDVGVLVVDDLEPYQRRKLWLLNGPHSAFAYAGVLAGCDTIAQATAHDLVAPFVARLVDEVLEVADVPDGASFAADALRRFRNAALGHTCRQVGADGSQKLPQRLLPVVAERRRRSLGTERFALVVAAWLAAATAGEVEDPSPGLAAVDEDPAFAREVAGRLDDIVRRGVDVLRDPT
jgi:fructuronate reductase